MFDNKYPYTDYHELNLDWFMGEFKKLVAEWEETKGEWNTLHDYVQNYFDNLSVQTEIDNKINAMILDGTFADIVSPFVTSALPALVAGQLPDVVAAQISSVVAVQISAVVADQLPAVAAAAAAQEVGTWLAAHIDPDTGYVIDDTLTVSNAAADAKTVGDIISNNDDVINDFKNINLVKSSNLSIYQTINNYSLKNDGSIENNSLAKLIKYHVTQGSYIYLKFAADTACTYRFSSSTSTGTGSVVGNPYIGSINGFVKVPAGAIYLFASQLQTTTDYEAKNSEWVIVNHTNDINNLKFLSNKNKLRLDGIIDGYDYESPSYTYSDHLLLKSDGTTSSVSAAVYCVTDYIDISAYYDLKLTAKMDFSNNLYCFYDENNIFMSGLTAGSGGTETVLNNTRIEIPDGAKYIKVGYKNTCKILGSLDSSVTLCNLSGKKWACVGDSLTADNAATTIHYFDIIEDLTQISPVNMGVGGSGYKERESENLAFYQRVLNIDNDTDVCTVFGSGNDISYHSVFGTYTDNTTDTVAGCINIFLDNYFSICPTAPIGIIAPTPWRAYPTTTPNNYMEQYVELLRKIANYRGVPFLDLYHASNLRPENDINNTACFYQADGTHPNELGHKIIAGKILEFVKSLIV